MGVMKQAPLVIFVLLLAVAGYLTLRGSGSDESQLPPTAMSEESFHSPDDVDVPVDNELARHAVEQGLAAPLTDIMETVRPLLKGDVVAIKFEQHFGEWMYEFRVVDSHGHLNYIHVDAKTGDYREVGGQPCESC
jgi:hypothetical protein